MTPVALERRLKELESQVARLRDEVRSIRSATDKDWRRTIGAFTDDEGLKEVLQDAMRLREADRRRARSKSGPKRGSKQ
jgi:hypothetical protein